MSSTGEMWAVEESRLKAAYGDRPAQDPRLSWSRWDHVFLMHQREMRLLRWLKRAAMMPLAGKRILEIGSGTGGVLRDLIKWGATPASVFGVDLLPEAIEIARPLLPAGVTLECRNAAELPFADASFDLVFQVITFSSIFEPELKRRIAAEMLRVLKPTGLIVWCDLRRDSPWNRTVKGITKRELKELFPACKMQLERIGLIGPVARRVISRSWLAAYLLAQIPLLCTQYLGTIQPNLPA